MENNMNQDTINNIKKLVDSGNISDAISQISPEMIENFSKMLNSNVLNDNNNTKINDTSIKNSKTSDNYYKFNQNGGENSNNTGKSGSKNTQGTYNSGFDFSKIDMNTIMKMKSAMENLNTKNDPRSNLLYSLKPYLRQSKQEKLDQYVNLLNFSKIAELLKNDKKDDKNV